MESVCGSLSLLLRRRCSFQILHQSECFLSRITANVFKRRESRTNGGAFGLAEQLAKVVVRQLHTADTSRLAVRHSRYGR